MNNGKNKKHKTTYKEVLMAFYEYLRRPKTVFDIKDRLKAVIFFAIVLATMRKKCYNRSAKHARNRETFLCGYVQPFLP